MKQIVKDVSEFLSILGRRTSQEENFEIKEKIRHLKNFGFVKLDHLVGSSQFKDLKESIDQKIEKNFELEFPCLAQSKIDPVKDRDLIESNFVLSNEKLKRRNLTFDKEDSKSYKQLITEFEPSTLTVPMPNEQKFYNMFLDPIVMKIITGYMGFIPYLTEAYIRRNFPAKFKIMNHNWHRDENHKKFLVKVFLFFTDCDIKTGAHHYIAGSINDIRFRDKVYYTDKEIENVWPLGSENHIVSNVPAGTIIIEDTRGLHKAGIPEKGFRDLGYSIFMPPNLLSSTKPLYNITTPVFNNLSSVQQKFIPNRNITR